MKFFSTLLLEIKLPVWNPVERILGPPTWIFGGLSESGSSIKMLTPNRENYRNQAPNSRKSSNIS